MAVSADRRHFLSFTILSCTEKQFTGLYIRPIISNELARRLKKISLFFANTDDVVTARSHDFKNML